MKKIISLFVVILLFGCAGRNINWDSARSVKLGMSESQLTEIMGQPYSITSKGEKQIWVYTYVNGFTGNSRTVSFIIKDKKIVSVPTIPDSF